jgi:hypothetical protein
VFWRIAVAKVRYSTEVWPGNSARRRSDVLGVGEWTCFLENGDCESLHGSECESVCYLPVWPSLTSWSVAAGQACSICLVIRELQRMLRDFVSSRLNLAVERLAICFAATSSAIIATALADLLTSRLLVQDMLHCMLLFMGVLSFLDAAVAMPAPLPESKGSLPETKMDAARKLRSGTKKSVV